MLSPTQEPKLESVSRLAFRELHWRVRNPPGLDSPFILQTENGRLSVYWGDLGTEEGLPGCENASAWIRLRKLAKYTR